MPRQLRRLPLLSEVLPPGVRPKLSVLMPVYNEAETIVEIIDEVLAFESPEVSLELIIIESNSTDGSRDRVLKYEGHPGVAIVLQEVPRGKGNAVREAMRHATGDIYLIQDGDLEYSVSDYPALIGPIVRGEADFVLGSRHSPGKPMRKMPDARIVSGVMNAAHFFFTMLFNVTYGTSLRDPFTMFKVFRADAVKGMVFVADRFDFDWEIMAKLVRAGFRPLEVPIDYQSRAYSQGKKVRPFRDPPGWIAACIRFRFARLYED